MSEAVVRAGWLKQATRLLWGPLAVVLAAYIAGGGPGPPAFLVGGLLGLAGLFRWSAPGRSARYERLTSASLLAYLVAVGVLEPLAFVRDARELLVALAWLSPVVAGSVLLPHRGLWLPGLGCWAVLFSGTTALAYNVSHASTGMGFLARWME